VRIKKPRAAKQVFGLVFASIARKDGSKSNPGSQLHFDFAQCIALDLTINKPQACLEAK
jgi:hypothetical protein